MPVLEILSSIRESPAASKAKIDRKMMQRYNNITKIERESFV